MSKLKNTHGIGVVYLDGDCDEGVEGYWNLFMAEVRHKSRPPHLAARVEVIPPGPRVQYLVTISCAMDDVPVRLFDTEDEVRDFCRANPRPAGTDEVRDHDWLGRDFTCVNGYDVVKFADGKPVACANLWDEPKPDRDYADGELTAEGADAIANLTDGPIFPEPEKVKAPLRVYLLDANRSRFPSGKCRLDVAIVVADSPGAAYSLAADLPDTNGYPDQWSDAVVGAYRDYEVRDLGAADDRVTPHVEHWVTTTDD